MFSTVKIQDSRNVSMCFKVMNKVFKMWLSIKCPY